MSKLIWISDTDQNLMCNESARFLPLETGGVLMGYCAMDSIVITNIVGPGPKAIHKPSSFIPDHDWQLEEISKIYSSSSRMHTYLGDWHSHPSGELYLGWRDRRTLNKIANCRHARIASPIMLVVAGDNNGWKLGAWLLTKEKFFNWKLNKIKSLHILEFYRTAEH